MYHRGGYLRIQYVFSIWRLVVRFLSSNIRRHLPSFLEQLRVYEIRVLSSALRGPDQTVSSSNIFSEPTRAAGARRLRPITVLFSPCISM